MSPLVFFRVAGGLVAAEEALSLTAWSDFAVPEPDEPPLCRIRKGRSATLHGVASVAVTHPIVHILRAGEGMLLGDRDCTRMTLCGDAPPEGLLLAGLSARLSLVRTVLLHGALVDIPTVGGVLFIGASGVGKSTQAELWQDGRQGRILNGDRVFLRMHNGSSRAEGYGSPWAGSSPYRVNGSVGLSLVVELGRAKSASVRRLSAEAAETALFCRALIPSWDAAMSGMTVAAAETLSSIAASVPTVALAVPNGHPEAGVKSLEKFLVGERSRPWIDPTAV